MLKETGENRILRAAAIGFVILMLSACAGLWPDRIGRIVPDPDAALIFEKNQCGADYQYYYSGSDVYAHAMIGLRKDIRLEEGTLWKKIDMTPERCRDMVSYMKTRALGLMQMTYGFAILDDRGSRIGIWYSILSATKPVSMADDHTALIHTPDVDTYTRFEKEVD
jgi:hypothetical protein